MIQVVISEAVMRKSDIGQGPFISCNFGESIQSFITLTLLLLKRRLLTTIDRTSLSLSFLRTRWKVFLSLFRIHIPPSILTMQNVFAPACLGLQLQMSSQTLHFDPSSATTKLLQHGRTRT